MVASKSITVKVKRETLLKALKNRLFIQEEKDLKGNPYKSMNDQYYYEERIASAQHALERFLEEQKKPNDKWCSTESSKLKNVISLLELSDDEVISVSTGSDYFLCLQ